MIHPDPASEAYQKKFLAQCSPGERRFHELMFKVGNTAAHYHQLTDPTLSLEEYMKQHLSPLELEEYKEQLGLM